MHKIISYSYKEKQMIVILLACHMYHMDNLKFIYETTNNLTESLIPVQLIIDTMS